MSGPERQNLPRRPRILYVLSCWPHDRAYGGQLRDLNLARLLAGIGEVTLALVGADPTDEASQARTRAEFPVAGDWPLEPTGVRGPSALGRLFTDPKFVNIHGLVLSSAHEKEIVSLARGQFDLIWFFQLRGANYFRQACWPGAVVDIDNLPAAMAAPSADGLDSWSGRIRAWIWQRALRRHERNLPGRFAALAVCSEADCSQLGGGKTFRVIPNGFARPVRPPEPRPVTPPRIGFIGLLEYAPNREGIRWFLKHCWPTLREAVPELTFSLAGQGAEQVLDATLPGVEVLGWVEDAGAEIATWSLMVIPIRSGAGTRIKIADTFSRKCPAVSTRLGAYGYDLEDGNQIRLADRPEDFAAACLDLLRDPTGAQAMAERAWTEFLEKWTWAASAEKVGELVGMALAGRETAVFRDNA